MAKVHAPLLAFNRGEVSKQALCRVDNERLRLAAESQVNWSPFTLGAMMLAPGTQYLFSTKSDGAAVPIPFIFGFDDTALLEITDRGFASGLQVIVDDVKLTVPSVSTAVTNGDFSSSTGWTLAATDGCTADINSTVSGALYLAAIARGGIVSCLRSVTVAGGDQNVEHRLRISITRGPVTFMCGSTSGGGEYIARCTLDAGLHSLAFTPTGGTFYVKFESDDRRGKIVDSITVESAGTLDLATPWNASDLTKLRFDQSGDIVFIACDGYQQRKIERRDNNSWSVVIYQSDDGPFSFVDTMGITLTPSVYEGNGTLTASAPYFTDADTDVGRMFRMFSTGQTKQAILGAANATTEAIRISGVGSNDRGFSNVIAGTFVGTLALERSVEGADTGFKEVATYTTPGTNAIDDHTTYDNVVVWYRIRWKTYTSGSATVSFTGTTTDAGTGNVTGSGASNSGVAGICRVTGVSSTTVVNIEVLSPFSEVTASENWQPSDWAPNDWPGEVRFFEGRLWWFRGDRRWGSESDEYYSFPIDGVGDSATINRGFGSGPIDRINFALDLDQLILGREMSIDPVLASSLGEVLTPTNNTARSCATKGAARLPALKVGRRGVYVEKSGRRVYQLVYDFQSGGYTGDDLTKRNLDIGKQGFVSLAVQEQPDTQLHFVRGDGQDAIMLFDPGEEVECWWRRMTLGVIENVVTLPGSQEDSVYYIVKRTINGSTKRFWEKQALRTECVGAFLSKNLDCHKVISQASSQTITGLSHLEGEIVGVWANGEDLGNYTVSSGQIEVSEAVTTAIVGLGYVSFTYDSPDVISQQVTVGTKYNGYPAEVYANNALGGKLNYAGSVTVSGGVVTLPNNRFARKIIAYLGLVAPFRGAKLAYGAQMGTAITQKKKVSKIGLVLHDTHYQGLTYGSAIDNLQPLPLSSGGQDIFAGTVFEEHEEPMVGLSGQWDTDCRLHLLAAAPRPATVAGVVLEVETSESR